MFETEVEESYRLSEEYSLIETARYRAREIYKKTGTAPPLGDDPAYAEFINSPQPLPSASADADQAEPDESEPLHSSPLSIVDCPLSVQFDGYGREILVESEDPTGRPMVWYQPNSKGKNIRYRRSTFGIIQELAPEININNLHGDTKYFAKALC